MIYALIAAGFTLIFGVAKIMFFAHGEIYMLAAVGSYFLVQRLGVPYPLTVVIVAIGTGILGLLGERLIRPLRGQDLPVILATVALGMIIANGAIHAFGTMPFSVPRQVGGTISLFGVTITLERMVIFLAAAAVLIGLQVFIKWTKPGQAIRALAQDRDAAQLQGVDVNRSAATVFFIAGSAAGIAAVLIAPLYYVDVFLGTTALMRTIIIVIIGGLGSFPGAILGGLFVGLIDSFGYGLLGGLTQLVSFALVVVLLIARPRGLLGRE